MISATPTLMFNMNFPTGSSENLTVVEDDEVDDGGIAGGKRINSHPDVLGNLLSQIIGT